jgi:HlyD family secretion protein
MKKNKTLWIVLGSLVLLLILSQVINAGKKQTKIAVELAELRTITEVVSVSGKIQPEREVKISSDVSGEIISMAVSEGDSVTKGQLLWRINPEIYQTNVQQLQANLDNAKASLASTQAQQMRLAAGAEQALAQYNRQKQLFDQKVISKQDMETAEASYKMAKADMAAADKNIQASKYQVSSVAARVDEGRKNLGRTNIYAPSSGIVTGLNSKQGERVVGTAQMAGTEMMSISDLSSMEVSVNINENDIVLVKQGDSADIKIEAYRGQVFIGVVTSISNSAKFTQGMSKMDQTTNFEVKIRINSSSYAHLIANSKQPIKPGMTATVDIKTQTASNVVGIPVPAVTTREPFEKSKDKKEKESEDEENKTYVFVYKDGEIKAREVEIGLQDLNFYEVKKGIKKGEEIVIAPSLEIAKNLMDGAKVKVVDKSELN